MFKKNDFFVLFCICVGFVACNPAKNEKTKLVFVPVSDSLYKPNDDYKQSLSVWRDYYQQCANEKLFLNAFYLQLQDKINIASINNEHELDISKGIRILDTSNYKNLFNLLEIVSSANCGDTIKLNNHLKKAFSIEVEKALTAAPEYKNLIAAIDTGEIRIRISSVFNNMLRTDSLINLINRTQDSSMTRFRELLLKPENVILAQTIDIFGFSAEFPLKIRLSDQQKKLFENEVFFNLDTQNDKAVIRLLANNILRIQVNKRYTILGRFLKLQVE